MVGTAVELSVMFSSGATLLGVLGGLVITARGQSEARRSREEAAAERRALSKTMGEVKKATDGMSDKLAATKLAQGTAEGHAAGLEQGREEKITVIVEEP